MDEVMTQAGELLKEPYAIKVIRALVILAVGWVVARLVARGVARLVGRRSSEQHALVFRRLIFYILFGVTVFTSLHQLGVEMSVLLGTAGVLTIAIGFAAQTSASNLISGLFLMGERPFVVGDRVKIGDQIGIVVTIDLLSVKLRTLDNLLVRVPNETLIKSQFTNLTRFPIRRFDVDVGVAYKESIPAVKATLLEVADAHPLALDEPKPKFYLKAFGDSSVNCQLWVWTAQTHWFEFKTSMMERIKAAFDSAGIEIAFPHRTIYYGDRSSSPVASVADAGGATPAVPDSSGEKP